MVVLPDHVNGVPEADTYQKLFRYDVEKLIETAKAAGVEPHPVGAATAIERWNDIARTPLARSCGAW
jgi:hypothetical protein